MFIPILDNNLQKNVICTKTLYDVGYAFIYLYISTYTYVQVYSESKFSFKL